MVIREVRGNTVALSSPRTLVEVDMSTYGTPIGIEIVRVMAHQTSGSGTTFTLAIGNKAAFAASSISQKYISGSTASSAVLDDTVSKHTIVSDDGKLYLAFTPNTGSDNIYAFSVMYQR